MAGNEPTARQHIVDTLRRHPRFDADFAGKMTDDVLRADKATQDRWIFQHAATWPDIARGLPAGERSKYDRPSWHYINLPTFLDPSDRMTLGGRLSANVSSDYPTSINERNYNVLQAIAYSQDVLSKESGAESEALAYCWLFHLVGDLHQPLHATALYSVNQFPEGDRGGNMIPLRAAAISMLYGIIYSAAEPYYVTWIEKSLSLLPILNMPMCGTQQLE